MSYQNRSTVRGSVRSVSSMYISCTITLRLYQINVYHVMTGHFSTDGAQALDAVK